MIKENTGACAQPGLTGSARAVTDAARDWLRGVTDLATLEIRSSFEALIAAFAAAQILAVMLFSSWALVLAAIAVAVVKAGGDLLVALLSIAFLNFVFAVLIWRVVCALIERIGMDGTRHALGLNGASNDAAGGESAHEEPAQTHPHPGT